MHKAIILSSAILSLSAMGVKAENNAQQAMKPQAVEHYVKQFSESWYNAVHGYYKDKEGILRDPQGNPVNVQAEAKKGYRFVTEAQNNAQIENFKKVQSEMNKTPWGIDDRPG